VNVSIEQHDDSLRTSDRELHFSSVHVQRTSHRRFLLLRLPCNTCRILAAWESRCGLEVQQTSVQKQTRLLCPFPFQFSPETVYRFCCRRIIIQHNVPLGHRSMREKELSNILIVPRHLTSFNECPRVLPADNDGRVP